MSASNIEYERSSTSACSTSLFCISTSPLAFWPAFQLECRNGQIKGCTCTVLQRVLRCTRTRRRLYYDVLLFYIFFFENVICAKLEQNEFRKHVLRVRSTCTTLAGSAGDLPSVIRCSWVYSESFWWFLEQKVETAVGFLPIPYSSILLHNEIKEGSWFQLAAPSPALIRHTTFEI